MVSELAAPVYIAAGTAVNGSGATLTPGLPAGLAQNDILVLQILQATADSVSPPTGYADLASSTEPVNAGEVRLFWKLATSSESAPSVGPAYQAVLHAIRGCPTYGNPWSVTAGTNATSTSSVSFGSLTSTANNSLILLATVGGSNVTISGWTNSGLSAVTGQVNSANANGHCHAGTGLMVTQGSVGTSTATLSGSATWMANLTVAFLPSNIAHPVTGMNNPLVRSSSF